MDRDDQTVDSVRFVFTAYDVQMVDDPANPGQQIEQVTPVETKSVQKSLAAIASAHAADFGAAYAAIKNVAYAEMASEGVFPAGTVV